MCHCQIPLTQADTLFPSMKTCQHRVKYVPRARSSLLWHKPTAEQHDEAGSAPLTYLQNCVVVCKTPYRSQQIISPNKSCDTPSDTYLAKIALKLCPTLWHSCNMVSCVSDTQTQANVQHSWHSFNMMLVCATARLRHRHRQFLASFNMVSVGVKHPDTIWQTHDPILHFYSFTPEQKECSATTSSTYVKNMSELVLSLRLINWRLIFFELSFWLAIFHNLTL